MDATGPDERQPLLGHIEEDEQQVTGSPRVDFDPSGDPENPLEWSRTYKHGVVCLLAFMAFTTTLSCIGVVPIADQIVLDLKGAEDKSASILMVTVWELGEAFGPLLIAPLSEIYGRYPVFNIANCFFILGVALAASAQTVEILIFARFLTGAAVASNVLNPSIIGDIFPSEERGSGMSLVWLAPLMGGAIGPAIAGAIAQTFGWRTILWMCVGVAIVCEITMFTLLRETYKVSILQRRAARLRKENNDESLTCAWDEEKDSKSQWTILWTTITRPFIVMWGSSVLQIMSIYGGFGFAFYYVMATTLPTLLREVYGFTPAEIGSSFLFFSLGSICGLLLCNSWLDRIYINLGKSRGGKSHPEDRLPFLIGGTSIFPFVVVLYGWVPYAHFHVSLFLLALFVMGFVTIGMMIPISAYIVDAFGIYSASAMTGVLIARCLAGTLLPLSIPPLTGKLGVGPGFLVVAAVALCLIPLPSAVMRYGARWRQKSVYTRYD